jgi:hypothetical protein
MLKFLLNVGALVVALYLAFDLFFIIDHVHTEINAAGNKTLTVGTFGYCIEKECTRGILSQLISNHPNIHN